MSHKPSWRDSLQGLPFQGVTATTGGGTGDSLRVEVSGDPAARVSVGAWRGSWNRKRTSVGHVLNTGGTGLVCVYGNGLAEAEQLMRREGRAAGGSPQEGEPGGTGGCLSCLCGVGCILGWGLIYTRKDGALRDAVGWALTDVHTTHHHSNQAEGFHPWRLSLGP